MDIAYRAIGVTEFKEEYYFFTVVFGDGDLLVARAEIAPPLIGVGNYRLRRQGPCMDAFDDLGELGLIAFEFYVAA